MTLELDLSSRWGLLLASGCALACESVLGAPDYHVFESNAHTLMTLYAADAPSVADCTRCLAGGECGDEFQRCTELPGCREFAACTLERPSPASEAECIVRLDPPEAVPESARKLSRCYAQCVNECGAGDDFSCAGAYSFPATPPSSTIRLTQTLRFLLTPGESVEGLEVSVCPPTMSCDDPIASAVTDETGTYSTTIRIETAPVSEAGFRGYRLVHGEPGRLFSHRLHQSRPIMIDQVEQTGIASELLAREVLKILGLGDELRLILLQILDCRLVGARGIYFELDSEEASVAYLQGLGLWGDGPTLASQEGSAAAVGVERDAHHEIRALTEDGHVVAVDTVYVPGDALVFSLLVPKEAE